MSTIRTGSGIIKFMSAGLRNVNATNQFVGIGSTVSCRHSLKEQVNCMSNSSNVSHWIDLVKGGDSVAVNRIWQHYFDRLVRSVRHKLYGQNRAVSDEEDIVLSVFDSFYSAVKVALNTKTTSLIARVALTTCQTVDTTTFRH